MPRPRTPSPVLIAAAFFAAAALVTGVLGFAASGTGPAAAGLTARAVTAPPGDPHPLWLPRHARLVAADVTHRRVMARAARQVARATARRQARAAAALAAQQAQQQAARQQQAQQQATAQSAAAPSGGVLTAAQIGQLWLSEGGSAAAEQTAICVAEHESGGNNAAVGSAGELGIYQINPVNNGNKINGVIIEASADPAVSTRDAIAMSSNGANWGAWSTAGACGA